MLSGSLTTSIMTIGRILCAHRRDQWPTTTWEGHITKGTSILALGGMSPRPCPWLNRLAHSQPASERHPYGLHFASCNSDKICNQPDLQPDFYNDRAILAVCNVVVDKPNGFLGIVNHAIQLVNVEHHSNLTVVNRPYTTFPNLFSLEEIRTGLEWNEAVKNI
jgi:hypothetical protein